MMGGAISRLQKAPPASLDRSLSPDLSMWLIQDTGVPLGNAGGHGIMLRLAETGDRSACLPERPAPIDDPPSSMAAKQMDTPPESMTIEALRSQLGAAYDRYGAEQQAQHLALMATVEQAGDVAVSIVPRAPNEWTITICTADRLGALSIMAGLFTAYHLDITAADIFTIQPRDLQPPPVQRRPTGHDRSVGLARPATKLTRPGQSSAHRARRKLLDIFELRALVPFDQPRQEAFRADLAGLVRQLAAGDGDGARDAIVERVSTAIGEMGLAAIPPRVAVDDSRHLLPVSIELFNPGDLPYTGLRVASSDTLGFLFAFTTTLAGFTLNIERAEIRTLNGQANDTFWVTDPSGGRIVGDERIHELRVATTLIKQFTHLLPRSPNPGQALRQFNALIAQMLSRPHWTAELANLESQAVLENLADLMGVSRFLWEDFLRLQHENLFPVVVDVPALIEPRPAAALEAELTEQLAAARGLDEHINALNAFKDRAMFRIDLRHITGRSDFQEFSEELTDLATMTVSVAAQLAQRRLADQYGRPTLADGGACPWVIGALGKFGGGELGFGSDLELIFLHAAEGLTTGPTRVANSLYFGRFVQEFQSIVRARQEGIFEIDLRLRPHGKAGHLASTLVGFAQYYAATGEAEQFERMALVRLRPVAGDPELGERMLAARDAFVYSGQPLDIANIRHLRHRQATELVPPGRVNAKYSAGGLVDIEYIVQIWQITVGATEPGLRVTNTLIAIDRLVAGGYLAADRATELRSGYGFLRQLIDALRVVRGNAKDLTIPPLESREFAYLAHRLHSGDTTELATTITAHMEFARSLWEDCLPTPGVVDSRP